MYVSQRFNFTDSETYMSDESVNILRFQLHRSSISAADCTRINILC